MCCHRPLLPFRLPVTLTPAVSSPTFRPSAMVPTPGSRIEPMNEQEMRSLISAITPSWAHANPSACINALIPLLSTAEGRKLLSEQERENALVLIELFDWVTVSLDYCRFVTRAENVIFQCLKFHGIPPDKGCVLRTLRQLCACQETLPKSCVLQAEFKPTVPCHAAGGFADVWKGTYNEVEMAFKSIRGSAQTDDTVRLKRKVRRDIFPLAWCLGDTPSSSQRRFCKEVVLWKSLNHPNVLGLVGVCPWDDAPDARLTMVSEWMTNGNVSEYIKRNDSQRMQLVWKGSLWWRTVADEPDSLSTARRG